MPKYTDEDIRNMSKITCKIAADYLGISPMAVSIGMRNDFLPIGFAIHNEEKRQHEKSAEEKEKSLQDSIRKSWYW